MRVKCQLKSWKRLEEATIPQTNKTLAQDDSGSLQLVQQYCYFFNGLGLGEAKESISAQKSVEVLEPELLRCW